VTRGRGHKVNAVWAGMRVNCVALSNGTGADKSDLDAYWQHQSRDSK